MSNLTLYHFPPSKYSQIARLTLAEKEVGWESILINIGPKQENYEPWYARINPEMVVPTLTTGDEVVCGTLNICRKLEEWNIGRSLTPSTEEARQRMESWLEELNKFPFREFSYGSGSQRGGILKLLVNFSMFMRRRTLTKRRDANPDLREAYQKRLDGLTPWEDTISSPKEMKNLDDMACALLDKAEEALQDTTWLTGEEYSLADVWMTVTLGRLQMLKKDAWIEARPRVAAYYQKVKARETFQQADVWSRMKPEVLGPIILKSAWPILLTVTVLCGLGVWWLLR